ncbi:hypothetical protein [Gluconacetobacter diazotrophicus]|uniref:hypothetical protein n=1 Tax=Gluconacetobacter diazotrophicus TaxID=33996 RepID=UPI00119AD5AC|nr:hypothetical protein [Gluconacetobacter diazotrophicus]TWB00739.1 hypothetical protein FBZ86_13319 [Gluconacetobacter diazotrophicus]
MAKTRSILKRQLEARAKIWPDITNQMLWDRTERDGFSTVPRALPLMMNIMDDLAGKGFPVGQTYFELWCRLYDELFLTLNRPEEMAFFSGFTGQRAVRTWKDRVRRLAELGFIDLKSGPLGDMSYAVFFNPYHIIKRAYLNKQVAEDKFRALVIRANEIGAFDLDDIDDKGALIVQADDNDDEEEEKKPVKKKIIRPGAKSQAKAMGKTKVA